MLKIYGSMLCPDCIECRRGLDNACVEYEFLDISEDLRVLKDFLFIRDQEPIFWELRKERMIGIPCLIADDGAVALNWSDYVSQDKA